MSARFRLFTLALLIVVAPAVHAGLCTQWDKPTAVGTLSSKHVREASGMAASKRFSNRVYWINDSGDKGHFYFSGADGKNLQKIKIADYKPRDTEALSIAECHEGSCLVLADIGDNRGRRKNIQLTFILEQEAYSQPVKILRQLTLEYPDSAHDAEALAFLPTGEMLLVTKEIRLAKLSAAAAGVYSLTKAEWSGSSKKLRLKKRGELPVPAWLPEEFFLNQVVTDMAVNSQRQTLGLLTYGKAVEIPLEKLNDLPQVSEWKRDRDYAILPLEALNQQESMTYAQGADRILWSSEYRMRETPIFSMTCTASSP